MITWKDVEKYLFLDYWVKTRNHQILRCTLIGFDEAKNELIFDREYHEDEVRISANNFRLEKFIWEDVIK